MWPVNSPHSVSISLLLDPTLSQRVIMITALCWAITLRVVLILYGLFGTIYRPIGPLKMGPIGFSETSVRNYHYSLRNSPKQSSSHLFSGESLKSHLEHVPVKSAPGSPNFFFTIDFADHHFCMQRLFLHIYAFPIPHSFRPVVLFSYLDNKCTNYDAPYDVIFQSTNQQ